LPQAGIDEVALETVDGRRVALGRLGQHRGQRALKLTETSEKPHAAAAPGRRETSVPTFVAPDDLREAG
ncbi:MAG TPA: hypothetical protein PLM52_11140, partial [Tabrizicola sp.]|nr:hypothetical protein [Tabrizicola sp.]